MRVETACGRVRWVKAGQRFTAVFHLSVSEKIREDRFVNITRFLKNTLPAR